MLEAALRAWLDSLTLTPSRIWVAFSGGPDSQALLSALQKLNISTPILAAHVNHRFSENSENWAQHCRNYCEQHDIGCKVLTLNKKMPQGVSIEAWARKQRYQWFQTLLKPFDVLCTAHTQDDQVETLILNLIRGSGLKGLCGIDAQRPLGEGWLMRPLLTITKSAIYEYLLVHNLTYVTDESNFKTHFDRNYIRNVMLPPLKNRFEGFESRALSTLKQCQEARIILDDLAEADLAQSRLEDEQLDLSSFLILSKYRQKNALIFWLTQYDIPLPSHRQIATFINQLNSSLKGQPQLNWQSFSLTRFKNTLYLLMDKLPQSQTAYWDLKLPLQFGNKTWIAEKVNGQGIDLSKLDSRTVYVCHRQGGERFKPYKRPTRPLKKWLQSLNIPPHERNHLPLIYLENELIAVADLLIEHNWSVSQPNQPGIIIKSIN